jgi:hypothetical protein
MKTLLTKLSLLTLVGCALTFAPAQGWAQEKEKGQGKPAEVPGDAKKAPNPNRAVPFRGKIAAVDKAAKTITVGARTFQIGAETKITKDGKPATLDDAVVGEAVRGSARQAADGKLNAVSVAFGQKPAEGEGTAPASGEKPAKKEKKGAAKSDDAVAQ